MARAIWNGAVLAQSDRYEVVEGNVYFPPETVCAELVRPSAHRTVCPWKGTAHYFDVIVDGKTNENAAWYYPTTKEAARRIEGLVAFWQGVVVER